MRAQPLAAHAATVAYVRPATRKYGPSLREHSRPRQMVDIYLMPPPSLFLAAEDRLKMRAAGLFIFRSRLLVAYWR